MVEADESDRSMLEPGGRDRGADERRARPPRRPSARSPSCARRFREFLAGAAQAVVLGPPRAARAAPTGRVVALRRCASSSCSTPAARALRWRGHEVELGGARARTTRCNAAAALEAARLAGADAGARGRAALAGFRGAGRRFQRAGRSRRRGARVRRLRAPPDRDRGDARGRAHARAAAAGRGLPAASLLAHARCSRASSARRSPPPTSSSCSTSTRRASAPRTIPGVSGLLVAEAAADAAGGRPVYWLPDSPTPSRSLRGLLGEGDLCVVMGAGDVDELARALADRLRERDAPGRRAEPAPTRGQRRRFRSRA